MRITFLGNFRVSYSSENHHKLSLEALGHKVIALQEGCVDAYQVWAEAIKSDMFVWVHTHGWKTPSVGKFTMEAVLEDIRKDNIPSVAYHLDLWLGLKRQEDLLTDTVYKNIEYFFTCDKLMADWFNSNTGVKGRYLPAGVFDLEANNPEPDREYKYDVAFVGSKAYHDEWPYRAKLVDWLSKTYGDRFIHVGPDGTGVKRGQELNDFYAETKVVVGDTLCLNFDYPYYWSDRLYETIGRGGFIIFPYIEGLEDNYILGSGLGAELVTYDYGNFRMLKKRINEYIKKDTKREKIRRAGFERTMADHTYRKRWEQIIEAVSNDKD